MQESAAHNVCLFGPQGSGKGTQAERLSEFLGVPQLSTGNIFRRAIADNTELGKQVEQIISEGQLVPDSITNGIVTARLEQEDVLEGYILDGYPRNIVQSEELDTVSSLTHVVVIDVSDEESIHRISQRRVCTDCGTTYHLESKPPQHTNVCDNCGHNLIQREDDTPDAIKERLAIYHKETEPLVARYEERGIVTHVDGVGSIDEVWERVQAAFV